MRGFFAMLTMTNKKCKSKRPELPELHCVYVATLRCKGEKQVLRCAQNDNKKSFKYIS